MDSKQKAVIKTLAYADIFDYPLRCQEIWQFLISEKPLPLHQLQKALKDTKYIVEENGYYAFFDRKHIVTVRLSRKKSSIEKKKIAKKAAFYLSYIPTVLFIGISGAVAMENAPEDDDIDFFIVTGKNALWITRLLCSLLLIVSGNLRRKETKYVHNKICLNLFIDESELEIKKHDIYTAHELVQLVPLINKECIYERLQKKNMWIEKLLPHGFKKAFMISCPEHTPLFHSIIRLLLQMRLFEVSAKYVQLWKMRKHRTREVITDYVLAFHPVDHRSKILKAYKKKVEHYVSL